jgi:hypothetical protein
MGVACHSHPTPLYPGSSGPIINGRQGQMYFSGEFAGVPGTYLIDLTYQSATMIGPFVGRYMQTASPDELFMIDDANQAWMVRAFDGQQTPLVKTQDALLAPNGRKFFYHDSNGQLLEGLVDASGGRVFTADGRFGSHSPSMDKVAYLNSNGLAISDSDGGNVVQADLKSIVNTGEAFLVPTTGAYFPRWTADESKIAAAVVLENQTTKVQRGVGVVCDAKGNLLLYLENSPTDPNWSTDGTMFFYVSANIIYYWDFTTNKNVIVSGGSLVSGNMRVGQNGAYMGYVQTGYENLSLAVGYDFTEHEVFLVLPPGSNQAYSVDWPVSSYCPSSNSAPQIVDIESMVNGVVVPEIVVSSGVNAVFRIQGDDPDCNLTHGVAVYQIGSGPWIPLSWNLPAGALCNGNWADVLPPYEPSGKYTLNIRVEDICGAQSNIVSVPITYQW